MTLDEIYAMFPNLRERAKSPGTRLSGGEQQMLAVARILRTGANLLLLDEISEGLAPVIVQEARRDDPHAQVTRLHHRHGRAEFPLCRAPCRPLLCGRAWQGGAGLRRRAIDRPSRTCCTSFWAYEALGSIDTQGRGGRRYETQVAIPARGRCLRIRRERPGADFRRRHQDRRDVGHVQPVCGHRRPGLGRRRAHGGRGLRRGQEGHEGRGRLGRSPEQAGRRLERRAPVVRHRQGRCHRRRADLVGGAGDQPADPREGQGLPRVRRGEFRPYGQGLLAQHDPLDLRHLDAGQRHRQRDRQDRW